MIKSQLFFTILMVSLSGVVRADIMILVHGYQSNADDWRRSGIVERLGRFDWRDSGAVFLDPHGQMDFSNEPLKNDKVIFTVHLPSEYPLHQQSQTLETFIKGIASYYPNEAIVLVGHSAGGVVARSALVRAGGLLPISQLITIASPHLGTEAATVGAMVADSALAMVAPIMGAGALNRSAQLYKDLQPEKPGTLLFMLNRQRHPRIEYVSMVRHEAYGFPTDLVVPKDSQRLENVYALRGLARSVMAGYGHGLHVGDADVIVRLIEGPRSL